MCKLSDKSGVPPGWKLTCHVATMKTNPMVPCSLFTAPNGRGFKTLAEVQEYIQSEPVVRRYSNNMKDAAQTNCHICGKTFKFTHNSLLHLQKKASFQSGILVLQVYLVAKRTPTWAATRLVALAVASGSGSKQDWRSSQRASKERSMLKSRTPTTEQECGKNLK